MSIAVALCITHPHNKCTRVHMRHSIKDRAGSAFDCASDFPTREILFDDSRAIVATAIKIDVERSKNSRPFGSHGIVVHKIAAATMLRRSPTAVTLTRAAALMRIGRFKYARAARRKALVGQRSFARHPRVSASHRSERRRSPADSKAGRGS